MRTAHRSVLVYAALPLALAFVFAVRHDGEAAVSPEALFSDNSASGLSIVPASCPSAPDYSLDIYGTPGSCSYGAVPPHSAATGYVQCALTASNYSIGIGGGTTLMWHMSPEHIYNNWRPRPMWGGVYDFDQVIMDGVGQINPDDAMTVYPSGTTSYRIHIHRQTLYGWMLVDGGEIAHCDATISVYPVPSCSIWEDTDPIVAGNATVLHWRTANADYGVYVNNVGWVGPNGDIWVAPNTTTDYSCYASGPGGSQWYGDTLTVYQPVSCSIWEDSNPIARGQATVMHWRTTGADYGVYINNVGWVGANGDIWVAPAVTTDYACYASGPAGSGWYGNTLTVYQPPTCSVWTDANPVTRGSSTILHWRTTNANYGVYINSVGWVGANGDIWIGPSVDTDYSCYASGSGGAGWYASFVESVVQPTTATIAADSTTINTGQSTVIRAAFTPGTHDALTCTNIDSPLGSGLLGYCSPFNKTYTFAPSTAGDYTFYARAATNYYGWTTYGSASVHVNTQPSCNIWLDSAQLVAGQGTTLHWTSAGASSFYINNIGYVAASGSTYVAPSQTTTYSGQVSGLGGTANCSGSTAVTVYPAPWCSLGVAPTTIIKGNFATLSWNSGNANSMSISQIGAVTPNVPGSTSISPSSSTSYSCTVNGALGSTATLNVSLVVQCIPAFTCGGSGGQTVMYTDVNCSTSVYAPAAPACVSPSFCSPGSSTCQLPPITFVPIGGLTGHLQIKPSLVRSGDVAKVYWNVTNVTGCTVTGSNGDGGSGWNVANIGPSGIATAPITGKTTYTLSCTGYTGATPPSIVETQTINVTPKFIGK